MYNWILPEYIEDLLPETALRMENLRHALLDLFRTHGYEIVAPPLLEYLDSLLTGTGSDLDLQTFKLVDQLSGKSMGLRADITPQTARIDAHLLKREGITRLCYAGTVVHTLPTRNYRSRELMQLGAELYGHTGYEADVEIQKLMLDALKLAGVSDLYLDIGHVGVFRGLLNCASIPADRINPLFVAMQAKDIRSIQQLTAQLPADLQTAFCALPTLYGGKEVLERAAKILPKQTEITLALDSLRAIIDETQPGIVLNLDLAELRGYHYHSGVVFAAYTRHHPAPLAAGGRYDNIGQSFGRARPATGFSLDLRELASQFPSQSKQKPILAPYVKDTRLTAKIEELRLAGQIVLIDLPGHRAQHHEYGCASMLEQNTEGEWHPVLKTHS
ncbi:MAG: ATP phosphoribosyltransferase regulatory subunit [Betaproteobacteria bacterium]|nr:ATP phosphoribosyltransferase regulatory subunit [Betaproteobacteria bacterium]